jgi:hypothetical protein
MEGRDRESIYKRRSAAAAAVLISATNPTERVPVRPATRGNGHWRKNCLLLLVSRAWRSCPRYARGESGRCSADLGYLEQVGVLANRESKGIT